MSDGNQQGVLKSKERYVLTFYNVDIIVIGKLKQEASTISIAAAI